MSNKIKQVAHNLIDSLPESAKWADIIYTLQVRHEIEAGLADADAGRIIDVSEIRAEYGILP